MRSRGKTVFSPAAEKHGMTAQSAEIRAVIILNRGGKELRILSANTDFATVLLVEKRT